MRLLPVLAAAAVSAAVLVAAAPARADASAWVFIGGGATSWKQANLKLIPEGAMTFDVGIGTSPDAPIIVGGLFRLQPMFGWGADIDVLGRVATHGFQAGKFGLALDAGFYNRFWWFPTLGFSGDLTLGAPFGLQVTVGATRGTDNEVSLSAVAGIDLLRLTVYRQIGLSHWPNPSPAQHVQGGIFSHFF